MRAEPAATIATERAREGYRVRDVRYRPELVQSSHAHEHASVSLILRGGVREEVGRSTVEGGAGSVIVKPAGTRHADRYSPRRARLITIELDASPASPAAADGEGGPADIGPWRWLHAAPVAGVVLEIAQLLEGGGGGEELDDRIVSLLAIVSGGADRDAGADPPAWLRRAREELEARAGEPGPVTGVAATVDRHPVYLARQFRRYYGRSPSEHLARLRRATATRLLADSRRSLAGVAHAAGYADQSHMCRDFAAALGATPGEFRRLAGRGVSASATR